MTIPNLQLLSDFVEGEVITQQETESVMVGAFRAILTAGIVAGIVIAFNKAQAEIKTEPAGGTFGHRR